MKKKIRPLPMVNMHGVLKYAYLEIDNSRGKGAKRRRKLTRGW